MNVSPGSPALLASAAFACLAAMGLLIVLLSPSGVPAPDAVASLPERSEGQPIALLAMDAAAMATITDRPLFEVERKPRLELPPVQEVIAEAEPPPLPRLEAYRVVGLISAGQASLALIERPGGGEALRLAIGDTLEGWTAQAITPEGIAFSARDERLILTIPKADGTATQSASSNGVPR